MPLGRDRIEAFVRAVGDELEGEWLLVGGAAAALWFRADRVNALSAAEDQALSARRKRLRDELT